MPDGVDITGTLKPLREIVRLLGLAERGFTAFQNTVVSGQGAKLVRLEEEALQAVADQYANLIPLQRARNEEYQKLRANLTEVAKLREQAVGGKDVSPDFGSITNLERGLTAVVNQAAALDISASRVLEIFKQLSNEMDTSARSELLNSFGEYESRIVPAIQSVIALREREQQKLERKVALQQNILDDETRRSEVISVVNKKVNETTQLGERLKQVFAETLNPEQARRFFDSLTQGSNEALTVVGQLPSKVQSVAEQYVKATVAKKENLAAAKEVAEATSRLKDLNRVAYNTSGLNQQNALLRAFAEIQNQVLTGTISQVEAERAIAAAQDGRAVGIETWSRAEQKAYFDIRKALVELSDEQIRSNERRKLAAQGNNKNAEVLIQLKKKAVRANQEELNSYLAAQSRLADALTDTGISLNRIRELTKAKTQAAIDGLSKEELQVYKLLNAYDASRESLGAAYREERAGRARQERALAHAVTLQQHINQERNKESVIANTTAERQLKLDRVMAAYFNRVQAGHISTREANEIQRAIISDTELDYRKLSQAGFDAYQNIKSALNGLVTEQERARIELQRQTESILLATQAGQAKGQMEHFGPSEAETNRLLHSQVEFAEALAKTGLSIDELRNKIRTYAQTGIESFTKVELAAKEKYETMEKARREMGRDQHAAREEAKKEIEQWRERSTAIDTVRKQVSDLMAANKQQLSAATDSSQIRFYKSLGSIIEQVKQGQLSLKELHEVMASVMHGTDRDTIEWSKNAQDAYFKVTGAVRGLVSEQEKLQQSMKKQVESITRGLQQRVSPHNLKNASDREIEDLIQTQANFASAVAKSGTSVDDLIKKLTAFRTNSGIVFTAGERDAIRYYNTMTKAESNLGAEQRTRVKNQQKDVLSAKAALTAYGDQSKKVASQVLLSWQSIFRLVEIQLFHAALGRMMSVVRQLTREFQDLEIKISEIRTISQDAQMSMASWRKEILELSGSYGVDVLQVATGVRRLISQQVAKGAGNLKIAAEAIRFSRIAVTEFEASINLLAGTMNAFDQSAGQAQETAALFFKTIELGRSTGEDLAKNIGRVLPAARSLGLTLEEVTATLAALEIQGVKGNEAVTMLNQFLLKLTKPSERMIEFLRKYNLETGEAAIRTHRLRGLLQLLADESEQFGEYVLGDVATRARATRFLQATTKAFARIDENTRQFGNAQQEYRAALEITFESMTRTIHIEGQKFRNILLTQYGGALTKLQHDLLMLAGGGEKLGQIFSALPYALAGIPAVGASLKMLRFGTNYYNTALEGLNTSMVASTRNLTNWQKGIRAAGITALGFGRAIGILFAKLGAVLIIGKLAYDFARLNEEAKAARKSLSDFATEFSRLNKFVDEKKVGSTLEQQRGSINRNIEEIFKVYFKGIAAIRGEYNTFTDALFENSRIQLQIFRRSGEDVTNNFRRVTTNLERQIDGFRQKIEESRKALEGLATIDIEPSFRRMMALMPERQQREMLQKKIDELRKSQTLDNTDQIVSLYGEQAAKVQQDLASGLIGRNTAIQRTLALEEKIKEVREEQGKLLQDQIDAQTALTATETEKKDRVSKLAFDFREQMIALQSMNPGKIREISVEDATKQFNEFQRVAETIRGIINANEIGLDPNIQMNYARQLAERERLFEEWVEQVGNNAKLVQATNFYAKHQDDIRHHASVLSNYEQLSFDQKEELNEKFGRSLTDLGQVMEHALGRANDWTNWGNKNRITSDWLNGDRNRDLNRVLGSTGAQMAEFSGTFKDFMGDLFVDSEPLKAEMEQIRARRSDPTRSFEQIQADSKRFVELRSLVESQSARDQERLKAEFELFQTIAQLQKDWRTISAKDELTGEDQKTLVHMSNRFAELQKTLFTLTRVTDNMFDITATRGFDDVGNQTAHSAVMQMQTAFNRFLESQQQVVTARKAFDTAAEDADALLKQLVEMFPENDPEAFVQYLQLGKLEGNTSEIVDQAKEFNKRFDTANAILFELVRTTRASLPKATQDAMDAFERPDKKAKGGIIRGRGGTDNVPAMLTSGEYVINKAATSANRDLLDRINSGGSSVGNINITIHNTGDIDPRKVADSISREIRRRTVNGLS
jgi:TP901 family phage tail tape measure protein